MEYVAPKSLRRCTKKNSTTVQIYIRCFTFNDQRAALGILTEAFFSFSLSPPDIS